MIIGILLGISLALNITSVLIIFTSTTGILRENLATGAVIGTTQIASYSFSVLSVSLISTLFLVSLLKNRN